MSRTATPISRVVEKAFAGSGDKPYEVNGRVDASKWLQADTRRLVNYGPEAGFPDGRLTPTNSINDDKVLEARKKEYEDSLKQIRDIADVAGIELEDMSLDEAGEFLAGLGSMKMPRGGAGYSRFSLDDTKHPPAKILSAVAAFQKGKLDEVSDRLDNPGYVRAAFAEAQRTGDAEAIYALRGRIPDAMYEATLERFNALNKVKGKSLSVDTETHKVLLPVVTFHDVPYGVVGKSVVYDISALGDEARNALVAARLAVKRDYSERKRSEYAEAGIALPDGSFPIRDLGDLRNAIKAYGRAKDKPAAKRHIVKRARSLKATAELPEGWG